MSPNISSKEFFTKWGLFLAIVAVMLGLLLYPTIAGKKAWVKNLKPKVESVLEEYQEGQWTVLDNVKVDGIYSMKAAAYNVRNKKSGELYTAVILRVVTFYGPFPAVFLCSPEGDVTFAGYASLHGQIQNQLSTKSDIKIEYWKQRIPFILQLGEENDK